MVATQHGVQVELDLVHFLEEEACDEIAWSESTVQQYRGGEQSRVIYMTERALRC